MKTVLLMKVLLYMISLMAKESLDMLMETCLKECLKKDKLKDRVSTNTRMVASMKEFFHQI